MKRDVLIGGFIGLMIGCSSQCPTHSHPLPVVAYGVPEGDWSLFKKELEQQIPNCPLYQIPTKKTSAEEVRRGAWQAIKETEAHLKTKAVTELCKNTEGKFIAIGASGSASTLFNTIQLDSDLKNKVVALISICGYISGIYGFNNLGDSQNPIEQACAEASRTMSDEIIDTVYGGDTWTAWTTAWTLKTTKKISNYIDVSSYGRATMYHEQVLKNFCPAGYWYDPCAIDELKATKSPIAVCGGFCPTDEQKKTITDNLTALKLLLLIGSPTDKVVTPWQTSVLRNYPVGKTSIDDIPKTFEETDVYKNDVFGLKTLRDAKVLTFEEVDSGHQCYQNSNVIKKSLEYITEVQKQWSQGGL